MYTIYVSIQENKCGENDIYSGFRYYDKCLYLDKSKPENLIKSWEDKTDDLWKLIENGDKSIGRLTNLLGRHTLLVMYILNYRFFLPNCR